jgi:hypothetical protein
MHPVHAGQPQVGDDEIDATPLQQGLCPFRIAGDNDFVARLGKGMLHAQTHGQFVFDEKN